MKTPLFIIGCFTTTFVFAQSNIQWQKSLGGSDSESVVCIRQTLDGGYILAGTANSNNGDLHGNHGLDDVWIVKLNSAGDTIWTRCYGGSSYDQGKSIEPTADGGYIVSAISYSNDGDVHSKYNKNEVFDFFDDVWILKLNNVGDTIWTKCYGGSNYDEVHSIKPTADGGYIFSGTTYSDDGDVQGNHYADCWIVKITDAGSISWARCYGGSNYEDGYSIDLTNDGGYIAAGYATSQDGDVHGHHPPKNPDEQVPDAWVIKLTEAGDTAWTKCLGGSNGDWVNSLQVTADGSYIFVATTNSIDGDVHGNHGKYDYWVVKLNGLGDTLWTKCFGGSGKENPGAIQLSNEGYIIAGSARSNDGDVNNKHANTDIWAIKLNENGDTLWTKCLGGSGADYAYDVQVISDENYVVAGSSSSNNGDVSDNHGSFDAWVVKFDDDILPVRFLSFIASLQKNAVQLNWKTANEINVAYFNIQRSVNGIAFTSVGTVVAKGNDNFITSYSYSDNINNLHASRIFYRLQETDKDGKIIYSNIIFISVDVGHIAVRPNPAKNKVYIQGHNILWVNIIDANGRTVIGQKPEADNGINISGLSRGSYIVQANDATNNNIITAKLIVE